MNLHLTLLVLLAAVMHAVWNTFVKSSGDRLLELTMVAVVAGLIAAFTLPWLGIPDPASWWYILASVIIHAGYFFCLLQSYRFGDLSHVYPLARGTSPLVVALLSGIFASEILNTGQVAGVLLVSVSVLSLALNRGWWGRSELKAVLFAVATGLTIGAYTLVDGLGVRLSQNAPAYIAWLFILQCLPLLVVAVSLRRGSIARAMKTKWRTGISGGIMVLGAYGLVIWALSLGAMAPVAALRETSVVIAALIGTMFLGEPFGAQRILAAVGVATGVMTLQLAG